jgi:hypothetical protein
MTELPHLVRPSNCRTAMTLPLADKPLRSGDDSTLYCLMPRQGYGQHKVESEAEITAKMNLNGQSSQVYITGEHRPET